MEIDNNIQFCVDRTRTGRRKRALPHKRGLTSAQEGLKTQTLCFFAVVAGSLLPQVLPQPEVKFVTSRVQATVCKLFGWT